MPSTALSQFGPGSAFPVVSEQASLRDAMAIIDRYALALCLVLSPDGVLVGSVSDGDIRRALLAGAGLDDAVFSWANKRPHTVLAGTDRSAVLDLMRALSVAQIPEVDERGRVLQIHLLQEIIGRSPIANRAVILAGGRGTRLQSVSGDLPKPMVRVAGRPILERLVLHLVGAGVGDISLAVGYRAEAIEEYFGDGEAFGCRITYLHESQPRGTAGPLRGLIDLGLLPEISEPLIVLNGDLVTSFSVSGLLAAHRSMCAQITVATIDYVHDVPYGVVETDNFGSRVMGLQEKPSWIGTVNAGVYAIDPQLIVDIPEGREVPMTELIQNCLDRGETVAAWRVAGEWHDVGQPADLLRARGG